MKGKARSETISKASGAAVDHSIISDYSTRSKAQAKKIPSLELTEVLAPTPLPRIESSNAIEAKREAPKHPIQHGSPTRQHLNSIFTPRSLEEMKRLALSEPGKPIKWLSEFFTEKSQEIETP